VQYETITTERQLLAYCDGLSRASVIAFDSEFVSEDTYLPDLCLVQVAADGDLAVIDARAMKELAPFWQQLAEGTHQSVVHAGREEYRFCLRAVGKPPRRWFDVQLAAAMVGTEYPASYESLVSKLLGKSLAKGETRTDWRRRPLSPRQLEYALQDVVYLEALRDKLMRELEQRNRTAWLEDELASWQDEVQRGDRAERWRRISGISGISGQSLAIVRAIWRWREAEAKSLNRPPRRILRDDLVVELARRGTADIKRIAAVRGLERSDLRRKLPELSRVITDALRLAGDEWPKATRRKIPAQVALVAQFLATALASICRGERIAPSLVGTVEDIRDLVAYRLELWPTRPEEVPLLAKGWRAEVVGRQLDQLLSGKVSMRISNPKSHDPLSFERPDQAP
jgi:ribonuclease D